MASRQRVPHRTSRAAVASALLLAGVGGFAWFVRPLLVTREMQEWLESAARDAQIIQIGVPLLDEVTPAVPDSYENRDNAQGRLGMSLCRTTLHDNVSTCRVPTHGVPDLGNQFVELVFVVDGRPTGALNVGKREADVWRFDGGPRAWSVTLKRDVRRQLADLLGVQVGPKSTSPVAAESAPGPRPGAESRSTIVDGAGQGR